MVQHLIDLASGIVYLLASITVYKTLFPRLLPSARLIATVMLMAQVFVLVIYVATRTHSSFVLWLWDVNGEWNVPATLATVQLALVGAGSLITALLCIRRGQVWNCLYFLGLGVLFFAISIDEYAMVHEFGDVITRQDYMAVGIGIALLSLLLAWRSPRPSWVWFAVIVFGLGLSGFGARYLDIQDLNCSGWGYIEILGECTNVAIMEETLEFIGIWLVLIAILGHFTVVCPPSSKMTYAILGLPLLWMGLLIQGDSIRPLSLQANVSVASVSFESGYHLQGYDIDKQKHNIAIHLYLSPNDQGYDGLGYSLTLVDQTLLAAIAARDTKAHTQLDFVLAPGYRPSYRQYATLEIPPETPTNRAMWIVLTLWRESNGGFIREEILSSDHLLLDDTQVILGEYVIKSKSKRSSDAILASFGNGFELLAAALPQSASAGEGEAVEVTFTWRADEPGSENLAQFLHFVTSDGDAFWNHDQQPLGDRLPTRLWYDGLADSETWTVSLPEDLPAGDYQVLTGLYGLEDQTRLIARDALGNPFTDSAVPLGNLLILNPNSE